MKRSLYAILFAAGLSGVAVYAFAQPHAGAPMHGFGDPLGAIAAVKSQLALTDTQQQQWDNAVALSKSAHKTMRDNFAQLKAATQAELASNAPNLAALAALADDIQQQNLTARKSARSAWLALYATFSQDQKLIVRDAMKARLDRLHAFRERLHERLQQ